MSSEPESKPVRLAVAAVVRRRGDDSFLSVRRPPDDDLLPDLWGLPAVTLHPCELPEQGLRRVGREKLGVELEPLRLVGIKAADRGDYQLILMDLEAAVLSGEPDVLTATTTSTRYTAQRWESDFGTLREAARRGSLCCQIALDAAELPY
jgi:ADP-ribose pyrophosphatase YjhB (NUDIX family)